MEKVISESNASNFFVTTAYLAIFAAALVILSLALLCLLSPEFSPVSRLVSEYTLVNYSWALSLVFVCWAVSCWSVSFALWSEVKTISGKQLYQRIARRDV